ncbi:MAG TPA: PIN domain-containing protein [Gemmatimonadales bacterium]|nr:PIN domain-containing protein [Gemmatimonadales bacterium]
MRVALDSNLLLYAEGINDAMRRERARELVVGLDPEQTFIPAQALAECLHRLKRQPAWSVEVVRKAVRSWSSMATIIPTNNEVLHLAADLVVDHQFQLFDGIILAAASTAGCKILYSEDLQHGFEWGGVRVVDPFREPDHPLRMRRSP